LLECVQRGFRFFQIAIELLEEIGRRIVLGSFHRCLQRLLIGLLSNDDEVPEVVSNWDLFFFAASPNRRWSERNLADPQACIPLQQRLKWSRPDLQISFVRQWINVVPKAIEQAVDKQESVTEPSKPVQVDQPLGQPCGNLQILRLFASFLRRDLNEFWPLAFLPARLQCIAIWLWLERLDFVVVAGVPQQRPSGVLTGNGRQQRFKIQERFSRHPLAPRDRKEGIAWRAKNKKRPHDSC
jgi:hypothetical protein